MKPLPAAPFPTRIQSQLISCSRSWTPCELVGDVREFGLDRETEPMFYSLGAGPTVTLIVKPASLDPAGIDDAVAIVASSLGTGAYRPRSHTQAPPASW